MSTNDEIRKARQDELASLIDECLSPLPFSGEEDLHPLVKESKRGRILRALARYLAPRPAQQGEDGELLDKHLEDAATSLSVLSCYHSQNAIATGYTLDDARHSLRRAITAMDAIRSARSHSKQEGGNLSTDHNSTRRNNDRLD